MLSGVVADWAATPLSFPLGRQGLRAMASVIIQLLRRAVTGKITTAMAVMALANGASSAHAAAPAAISA
jgi:hypothetical protein